MRVLILLALLVFGEVEKVLGFMPDDFFDDLDLANNDESVHCSNGLFIPSINRGTWQEAEDVCANHNAILPSSLDISMQEMLIQLGVMEDDHVWLALNLRGERAFWTETDEEFKADRNVNKDITLACDATEGYKGVGLGTKARYHNGCPWFQIGNWCTEGTIVCQNKCPGESNATSAKLVPSMTSPSENRTSAQISV